MFANTYDNVQFTDNTCIRHSAYNHTLVFSRYTNTVYRARRFNHYLSRLPVIRTEMFITQMYKDGWVD